jgi:hypothetical protein
MSFHVISCHFMSFHVILLHFITFHLSSCHFMSYSVIQVSLDFSDQHLIKSGGQAREGGEAGGGVKYVFPRLWRQL